MAKNKNFKQTQLDNFFKIRALPAGPAMANITPMPSTSEPMPTILPPTQKEVQLMEPYGSIPTQRVGRISGYGQVQNLSAADLTITKVQAAFRTAERGDTRFLFTYYRDLFLGTGPVSAELQKRKLAVISSPYKILPFDKDEPDDVEAAQIIENMIMSCRSWRDDLIHLMNAILFPVSVSEKIFTPWDETKHGMNKFGCRYHFDAMSPVDYQLLCYRLPYLPGGPLNPTSLPIYPNPQVMQSVTGRPQATVYNPDEWEPWLRFWSVLPNGLPIFDFASIYEPDPMRHLVYRCNLFNGIARDNFGGLGKAVLFWAIMAQQGKEYWLRYVDQFGSPFIVAKVDTSQADTVEFLTEQFQLAMRQHAIIVNKDADLELAEAATSAASQGHEKFLQFCHDQIAVLISGQTLSTTAKSTGLGSGVANLQSQVRQDIIDFDRQSLGDALRVQLFDEYLKINGHPGNAPKIIWGGTTAQDGKLLADTLAQLATAGVSPTKDAMENISERLGFPVQISFNSQTPMKPGQKPGDNDNNNPEDANENEDEENNQEKESELAHAED